MKKILVCGLRGSGKSTYAFEHMQNGLVYDMDAIASAFRLRMPHEEYHKPARKMANDLLRGFLQAAERYTDRLIIIRTAPRIEEASDIEPDAIIICDGEYVYREMDDREAARGRLKELDEWARFNGVPVKHV